VDSRKQNKEKKRHASPAGIKKDRKKQTPLSLVWNADECRDSIPKSWQNPTRYERKDPKKKGPGSMPQPGYPERLAKVTVM
jgi:hypothetical protein